MKKPSTLLMAALVAAFVAAPVHRAAAQVVPVPHVSLMGGVSQYDLSGTGSTPFGAIRLNIPLAFLIAEGSLGVWAGQGGLRRAAEWTLGLSF